MKSFDEILDISVRNRIYLQRLAESHSLELAMRMNKGSRENAGIIRDGLETAATKGMFTRAQNAVLATMQKELADSVGGSINGARDWYIKELGELAAIEISNAQKILGASLPVDKAKLIKEPSLTAVKRLTERTPYSGYSIEQWFKNTEDAAMRKVMARVRVGIANGESIDKMVQAIRGSRASGYTDGVLQGYTTKQARMMSRTLSAGVSNAAHQDFFKANADLIAYEEYTATLDGRTSLVCASLDGKKFEVGDGPVPPLHPNCRSLRIAVTKAMAEESGDEEGTRPYVRDADTPREREKRFRREAKDEAGQDQWKKWTPKERNQAISNVRREWAEKNKGTTKAGVTYQTWLKRQPAWFQKEALGSSRYKLFSEGGLELSKFVDLNGQQYTLEQLRKIETKAFKRAGIL